VQGEDEGIDVSWVMENFVERWGWLWCDEDEAKIKNRVNQTTTHADFA